MTDAYPWYAPVTDAHLEQGDFLSGRPLFQLNNGAFIYEANVIVVNPWCDFANDKLEIVQVCPYWPLESLSTHVEYLQHTCATANARIGKTRKRSCWTAEVLPTFTSHSCWLVRTFMARNFEGAKLRMRSKRPGDSRWLICDRVGFRSDSSDPYRNCL